MPKKNTNKNKKATKIVQKNLVNKQVETKEGKDKALLLFIISMCILLAAVILKKHVIPHIDINNNKEEIVIEDLDINSEQIKTLYNYVNVIGTGYDYFIGGDNIDLLTLDNKMKLILAFNLINEESLSNLIIPDDVYQKAMEGLLGENPYYINSEPFDVCVFKNINNENYNCFNVMYDSNTKNYNLTRIDSQLESCKDGYAKTIISAVKDNNQIIIKSGYAYVTNVCETKISVYDSEDKINLIGTIDNDNMNNNYYNVDITSFKDNIKTINYVFQLGSDNNYHFYKSYKE